MCRLDLPAGELVDAIDEPVLLVGGDRVVACNDAMRELVGGDTSGPIRATLSEFPALARHVDERADGVVTVRADGAETHYRLAASGIDGSDLDLIVLHDVTDRQELQRENEQLDRFASFISHDLRNPLDVAIGHTTVVDDLVDDPEIAGHVEEIQASHSRMLRIIEDVLTLARDGQSIDDKYGVDLAEAAREAWSHVETDSGTLEIRTDLTVMADPNRLGQIYENLFRNSREHGAGDGPVTVTVGELDDADGFYVADDGRGIDPEVRDRILETGHSAGNGTGIGLAIVSNIARAHGWEVAVTGSAAGGARFEFSGVETAPGDGPDG